MGINAHIVFLFLLNSLYLFNYIMQNKQSVMTDAVLANGAELAARVIEKLNPEAVAGTVGGNELTRQTIYNTAQVVFQQEINISISGQNSPAN